MEVAAILSMLHEPPDRPGSAARQFRDRPVMDWTLRRLRRSQRICGAAILCWEDQLSLVQPIAAEHHAKCIAHPRTNIAFINTVAAARRWADGWRGGLLGTCDFDRGFHAAWMTNILENFPADAAILVDPAAGLIDAALIDALIDHADRNEEAFFCFSAAAPGLSAPLIRKGILSQLVQGSGYPGMLLGYRPDLPMRDPISTVACAPVAAGIARTMERFTLDSNRQIKKLSAATQHLNGQLISTGADMLLQCLANPTPDAMPRDVALELTARRMTKPIFSPANRMEFSRDDLPFDQAKKLIDQIAATDDVRLFLGGVGDPLLSAHVFQIIDYARQAGITAIALETDLIKLPPGTVERLADSPVDIVTIHLPAATAATYQKIMGVDGIAEVINNLRRLIECRRLHQRGTPIVAPVFVKTGSNMAEMEAWYDHWLRTLNCAVIAGPSDFAGLIEDASVAQMEPPKRRPCRRLAKKLTVLCDGAAVSCEEDVLGQQPMGNIAQTTVKEIWNGPAAQLRADHEAGQWKLHPRCAGCRQWHRP